MEEKKYAGLDTLRTFLNNLKTIFSPITHKHTLSDLTDYTVDTTLSSTSTNPVANSTLNAEFDAISDAMGALENAIDGKSDSAHTHDDRYYTESEIDSKVSTINTSITNIVDGTTKVAKATSADSATNATNATNATKATQDANGKVIADTYETKSDASAKLTEAKSYADSAATAVKNDLLNGAGGAYDTLKELGDLIDENVDAIDALETIAAGKQDKLAGVEGQVVGFDSEGNPIAQDNSATFIAIPNVTTYAEAMEAYNAGKAMYCYDTTEDRVGVLYRASESEICWVTSYYQYLIRYDLQPDNTWDVYEVPLAPNISNLTFLGENPTAGSANDTTEFWADKESGRAWISSDGMLIDQPSTYGILINYTYAADVFQIFRSQSEGPTYFRSGNMNGWSGTWEEIATTDNVVSKKCIHKETGDITDLYGTESCRYVIGNEVTSMPIENEWWIVDFMSNGNTDAALTAYPMNNDAPTYVRYLVNDVWSEWKEVVTKDSNGYINSYGFGATNRIAVDSGEQAMAMYPNGIGSERNGSVWIDYDGDAYFTEVYASQKKVATQEYVDIRVPAWTSADEGKFLRIVNGVPTWATINNAEGVSF